MVSKALELPRMSKKLSLMGSGHELEAKQFSRDIKSQYI